MGRRSAGQPLTVHSGAAPHTSDWGMPMLEAIVARALEASAIQHSRSTWRSVSEGWLLRG